VIVHFLAAEGCTRRDFYTTTPPKKFGSRILKTVSSANCKHSHTFPNFLILSQLLAHILSFSAFSQLFAHFFILSHLLEHFLSFGHSFSTFGAFSKTCTPFGLLSQLLVYFLNLCFGTFSENSVPFLFLLQLLANI